MVDLQGRAHVATSSFYDIKKYSRERSSLRGTFILVSAV